MNDVKKIDESRPVGYTITVTFMHGDNWGFTTERYFTAERDKFQLLNFVLRHPNEALDKPILDEYGELDDTWMYLVDSSYEGTAERNNAIEEILKKEGLLRDQLKTLCEVFKDFHFHVDETYGGDRFAKVVCVNNVYFDGQMEQNYTITYE